MTKQKTSDFAILKYKDSEFQLPILESTDGPNVIDISELYKRSKVLTFDPAFMSTASCESKITFIDGDNGILRYRGYPIEELAQKCDFMEVSHLLMYGELPDAKQKERLEYEIKHHSLIHEQMHLLFSGFKRHSHPMSIMVGAVGTLSSFYHDSLDIKDAAQREISAHRLIAKIATLAAMTYKYKVGQPFIYPRNDLSYTENFLHMMFATPSEKYIPDPILAKALDKIFILHADHEQNASTSTVRIAGSSGANPFACIAAGIASLWGPLHGGANEAVINMLEQIGDVKNIPGYIAKTKDKNNSFKLMGFGHRVYKNFDPRSTVMRETCHEVLDKLNMKNDKLFEIALELEKIALNDQYFIEKKLYPNVDFYSGIIYRALQIPSDMYTVMFAIARTVGWVSQWLEMTEDSSLKISRPRQLYTGSTERHL